MSMDRKNLQLLKVKPYRVSWKADGTRCSLFAGLSNACMICEASN